MKINHVNKDILYNIILCKYNNINGIGLNIIINCSFTFLFLTHRGRLRRKRFVFYHSLILLGGEFNLLCAPTQPIVVLNSLVKAGSNRVVNEYL